MTTIHKHFLGLIFGAVLVLNFLVGCGGGGSSHKSTPATLASIEVTPTNPSIAIGTTQQFKATGIYSDGTKKDLTASVTWSSLDTAKANISDTAGSKGLATSIVAGTTTIKAMLGTISGSTTLTVKADTVTLVSIEVTPTNPNIALGTSQQFTATGIFSDNSKQDLTTQVAWDSVNKSVATIDNTGLATSVSSGATIITAAFLGKSGDTTLTVKAASITLDSIDITPTNPSIAVGTTQQFMATGIFSDNSNQDLTTQVTWSSSNIGVATIDNAGLAISVSAGSTTVAAALGSVSGNTILTVTSATLVSIGVSPTNPSISLGTNQRFTATGVFSDGTNITSQDLTTLVTWGSGTPRVAIISNAPGSEGMGTSVLDGSTTITATFGGKSGSTLLTVTPATLDSIEVTPTNPSIALGTPQQFTATGIFSDGSKQDLTAQVTWSSSNPEFATIDNTGLATSVAEGPTSITATLGSVSGSTSLTVTSATLVSIGVTPANQSIAKGLTLQFTAVGIYSDNTKQDLTTQVTWSSSDVGVATISNAAGSEGVAVAAAVNIGSTTIRASLESVFGETSLTVTAATLSSIEVTPAIQSIAKGLTLQFTATGIYSDNTTQDLTTQVAWTSSSETVVAVSNAAGTEGLATAINVGSTTITAAFEGKSGNTQLTVTAATLSSIEVTPTNQSLPKGLTLQYTATGIYSDNTTQDLTTQVTWSSSDETIATISNAADSEGLAAAVGVGLTTVRATLGSVFGETELTVTAATLSSISVTPTNQSIAKGLTLQYTATGTYSDSTIQDLTTQVTWSSADTSVVSVSNASGSEGLATAVNLGTTTVTATLGNKSGSTTLTVTDATLQSISVTPTSQIMALGTKLQYTATGIFSDATQVDLTKQVTWSSSNTGVAVISNGNQTKGLATSIGVGSTTITATFGGKSGSAALTVITTAFSFIEVTPATPTIAVGGKLQFMAIGHFPGGSTQDLTLSVTWSSSVKTVATISNARKTRGMATGVSSGSTTIRATTGGMSGTTTLTVSP